MIIPVGGRIGGEVGSSQWITINGSPRAAYNAVRAQTWEQSLLDLSGSNLHIGTFNMDSSRWESGVGWKFNGTDNRIDLPFGLEENSTIGIRFTGVNNNGYLFGAGDGGASPFFQVLPSSFSNFTFNYANGSLGGAELLSGTVICSGPNLYHNGVLVGTSTGTWSGPTATDNTVIGARIATVYTGYCEVNIQAVIVYSSQLNSGQVVNLHNEMNNL